MTTYKVKQLSELTGISVKTLHHYDKIGLLNPAIRTEKNYRLYSKNELYRLQQILLYKELGLPLSEIRILLDDRNFDQLNALKNHKLELLRKKERIEIILKTLDKTISQIKKKKMITDKELYEGFDPEEIDNIKTQSKKKFGERNFNTSEKYLKSLSKVQFEGLKIEQKEIFNKLLDISSEKIESPSVQLEISRLYQNIRKFWGTSGSPSTQKSEFKGLAQLYQLDHRYTKVIGQSHDHFTDFLSDAMFHFAKTQL